MLRQVIAHSTMSLTNCRGDTFVCHCLMAIEIPVLQIHRTNYILYIWHWNNAANSQIDSEIDQINTLCGNGRVRPNHIVRIEKDLRRYCTSNDALLMNVALNFKFNGWHGIDRSSFSDVMNVIDDDVPYSTKEIINDYITNGVHAITEARRNADPNACWM